MSRGMRDKDWNISVGLDTSAGEKKVTDLENRIRRLNRAASSGSASPKNSSRAQHQTAKANNSLLREENRLNLKREMLHSKIDKLQRSGALKGAELTSIKARVSSTKDLNKLQALNVDLVRRGRLEARKVTSSVKKSPDLGVRKESLLLGMQSNRQKLLSSVTSVGPNNSSLVLKTLRQDAIKTLAKMEQLQQTINKATTPKALQLARIELRKLNMEATPTVRSIQRVTRALAQQNMVSSSLSHSFKNMVRSYASLYAVGFGIMKFFHVGEEMESLQATMLAASGSTNQAAKDFEYVKQVALHLGVDLQESSRGFAKIGTAARAANFSVDQTRNIFMAASEASRAYGLSAQRTQLVYLAFEQILSKGVVSMEELRRQLGEQIPGAFQIAAKAMGVTTSELNAMVSSGSLASEEFLPKFADQLRKTVRESGALAASLKKIRAEKERFFATTVLQTDLGFKSAQPGFAAGFKTLTGVMKQLGPTFQVFGKILGSIFSGIASILSVLVPIVTVFTNSLNNLFQAFDRAGDVKVLTKDLTFLEVALRAVYHTGLFVKELFLELLLVIVKFTSWLGISEDQTAGLGKQLLSLVVVILTLIPIIRAFRWVFVLLFSPFKKILTMLGVMSSTSTVTATRVGLLSTAFAGLKSRLMSILSLSPALLKLFPKLLTGSGALAAVPYGMEAVDAWRDPKKSKADALTETAGFAGGAGMGVAGGIAGFMVGGPIGAVIGAMLGAWAGEGLTETIINSLRGNGSSTSIISNPITIENTFTVQGDYVGDGTYKNSMMSEMETRMKRTLNDTIKMNRP